MLLLSTNLISNKAQNSTSFVSNWLADDENNPNEIRVVIQQQNSYTFMNKFVPMLATSEGLEKFR